MSESIFQDGVFKLTAAQQARMDALLRQTGLSSERRTHELMGQAMAEPIRQIADYKQWANQFFVDDHIRPGEDNRIPVDSYTVVAFYSSPTGQVLYTRPGRAYTRPDFTMIDCGLEIGWDTLAMAGWNILARKQLEAAEELARKEDSLAKTVLDAAVVSVSHTSVTAAGGVLTKAATDLVFQTQAANGFPVRQVAVNIGDAMDMTGWTVANSLWEWTDAQVMDLTTQMFWGRYGGAVWYAHHSVPASYVYFGGAPQAIGYRQRMGGVRTASDIDIDKKGDKHTWDKKEAYYVGNPYNLWRLYITP